MSYIKSKYLFIIRKLIYVLWQSCHNNSNCLVHKLSASDIYFEYNLFQCWLKPYNHCTNFVCCFYLFTFFIFLFYIFYYFVFIFHELSACH